MAAAPQSISVAEARQLVESIQDKKGFLSEDDLDAIDPPGSSIRRKVENAMLRKDKIIGQGVLTYSLAKNLYTSNARFVFELLQNADDNNYSRATACARGARQRALFIKMSAGHLPSCCLTQAPSIALRE
ncbi:hypothetical protein F5B22DRAFT_136079 [Xylaria bambusicola]|uniref:uncharacterized protein n=1 Tax=Xylaria bambusicola TaxID=326684 RepID=UPI00200845E9|nr:uncharacterized protein F5B22DRAFT_136079 [Xylaria bambusicola]KAI0516879.1 hypothetical protein F5B22DRAFT_136079 [Xylaria bambusicola]